MKNRILKTLVVLSILFGSTLLSAQTISGSLTAVSSGQTDCTLTNCVTINLPITANSILFNVSGTFNEVGSFEFSPDNGLSWRALTVTDLVTLGTVTSNTATSTTPATWTASNHNFTQVRVRITTFTSGTGTWLIRVSGNNSVIAIDFGSTGASVGSTVTVTGVSTATNQTSIQTPITAASATATKGELLGCQYYSSLQTFTNGQQGTIPCDVNGRPLVAATIKDSSFTDTADATAHAVKILPVSTSGTGINITPDVTFDADTGAGTQTLAAYGIAVPRSGGSILLNQICAGADVTSVNIADSTSGSVELVALSGSTVIYVCGYSLVSRGTVNAKFIRGTGTACATGSADKTGAMSLIANSGIAIPNGGGVQFKGNAGDAICINLSAGIEVDGILTYVQVLP